MPLEGVTGKMITFKRADGEEYSLEYGLVDVCDVCNKKNHSQLNGCTSNNSDISPEFCKLCTASDRVCRNMYLRTVYRNICTESKIAVNISPLGSGDF